MALLVWLLSTAAISACTFVLFVALYFRWNKRNLEKSGIPYVGGTPFAMIKFMLADWSIIDMEKGFYAASKATQSPVIGTMDIFGQKQLMITDLDLLRHVYVKDFDYFVNRRPMKTVKANKYMNKNLVNMENEEWKAKRALLSPTFTTGKIRKLFQIFVSSSTRMENYIRSLMSYPQSTSVDLNLSPLFSKYAMDVIANCAFGVDSQTWNLNPEEKSTFETMAAKLSFKMTIPFIFRFMMSITFPRLADAWGISAFDVDAQEYFANIIRQVVQERKAKGTRGEDFLQLMLDSQAGLLKQDEETSEVLNGGVESKLGNSAPNSKLSFDEDDIIGNCATFLSAGFDTTQSLMMFMVYTLALEQDIQEKCWEEVKRVEERRGKLDYDAVTEMTYLEMVMNETLRFYPPSSRTERVCTKTYTLPGTNHVIEKGTVVVLPIFGVQHDQDYFQDPEKFIPERFSPENKGTRHPYAFAPFGHGPRNCIGMRFALIKVKTLMAHLIRAFRFEPCAQTKIPVDFDKNFIIKTKSGMWLKLNSR